MFQAWADRSGLICMYFRPGQAYGALLYAGHLRLTQRDGSIVFHIAFSEIE
jgi:hypothetical protein